MKRPRLRTPNRKSPHHSDPPQSPRLQGGMGILPMCGGTPPLGPVLRPIRLKRSALPPLLFPKNASLPLIRPAYRSKSMGTSTMGRMPMPPKTPASRSDSECRGAEARSWVFGGRRAGASSGRSITKDESRRSKGGRQGNPANRPRRPATALPPPEAGGRMAKTFW